MKYSKRESIFESLNKFCVLSKDSDYIEITEWSNMEGYDIDISGEQLIRLTHGQLNAVKTLAGCLDNNIKGEA